MSLRICDLSFSYGDHQVLHDLSFEVADGTLSCVLGPNGVGKTTLFRCVLGLNEVSDKTVLVNGHDLKSLSVRERAREMSYIPQAHASVFNYRVLDVVLMARTNEVKLFQAPSTAQVALAQGALERVGISDLCEQPFAELSGGQQQLVLVARAIAQDTPIILMDEPTSALDFAHTTRVLDVARSLADEGHAVLMTTHQPEHAFGYSDQVLVLDRGRLALSGTPDQVITSKHMSELYGIDIVVSSLFQDSVRVCTPRSRIHNNTKAK